MFIAFWIGWALIGLMVAVLVFVWAMKTRQFEESRRAALIPFDDILPEQSDKESQRKSGLWIVVVIFAVVFVLIAVMLALSMQAL